MSQLSMSRRGFLTTAAGTAGAVAAAPLLAACGTGATATVGSTSTSSLAKILPAYVPLSAAGIKPDYPSVDGSEPGYLSYPTTLVHTVSETPGSGGSYTAIAPTWGSIPRTSGNTYYQALNSALGANMQWQPTNGTTITTTLPTLFAGNQVPDWIEVPTFAEPPGFGQAAQDKLADLTPYLSGDKIKEYPNLAAIFSNGWQQGIWNDKIVGIPTVVAGFATGVFLYYRADILESLGIGTPSVKSLADLYDLGKEINDPGGQALGVRGHLAGHGLPLRVELRAAVRVDHGCQGRPDHHLRDRRHHRGDELGSEAVQRRDGQPGIGGGQHRQRQAALLVRPERHHRRRRRRLERRRRAVGFRVRQEVPADGVRLLHRRRHRHPASRARPAHRVPQLLQQAASSQTRSRSCCAIANYLAAPFGSYEFTLVNYGAANTDYTMTQQRPGAHRDRQQGRRRGGADPARRARTT